MTETVSDDIVGYAAFRDGKLIPHSLTRHLDELEFEAAGDWVGCEIRAIYALPTPPQNTDGEAARLRELIEANAVGGTDTCPVVNADGLVGDLLGFLSTLKAERDALRADLTRYIDIATKEATEAESLRAERDALAKALEGAIADIRSLANTQEFGDTVAAPYLATLKGDAP